MEDLILIHPTDTYADQIAAYRQEFLAAGDSMDGTGSLRDMETPADWLQQVKQLSDPATLPAGWVQSTQFLCIRPSDDRLVGMIQVRHSFNEYLERFGGHIGYSVRPTERRKGYAKQMLRACLPHCREIGLDRVLVTCDETNVGSRKTILANGGVYEITVREPGEDSRLERYWIDL